jgi:tetratricopeptide (TPR) repeat protein
VDTGELPHLRGGPSIGDMESRPALETLLEQERILAAVVAAGLPSVGEIIGDLEPGREAWRELVLGEVDRSEARFTEAAHHFRQSLNLDPSSPLARAACISMMVQPDRARELLERLANDWPTLSRPMMYLAGVSISLMRYREAQMWARKAVTILSTDTLAWFVLGRASIHLGDRQAAIEAAEQMLERAGTKSQRRHAVIILAEAGRLRGAQQAIQSEPELARPRLFLPGLWLAGRLRLSPRGLALGAILLTVVLRVALGAGRGGDIVSWVTAGVAILALIWSNSGRRRRIGRAWKQWRREADSVRDDPFVKALLEPNPRTTRTSDQ